jgi:putative endonuclease
MYYLYVLKSKKDEKIYIGFTIDLKLRFQKHNNGEVRSTKYRCPLELIYYEAYKDEKIARRRERQLKSGKAHIALKKRLTIHPSPEGKVEER